MRAESGLWKVYKLYVLRLNGDRKTDALSRVNANCLIGKGKFQLAKGVLNAFTSCVSEPPVFRKRAKWHLVTFVKMLCFVKQIVQII